MARTQSETSQLHKLSTTLAAKKPMAVATYSVMAVGLSAGAATIGVNPLFTLLAAAILCGWSEVDGLCGSSHVCALTPLRLAEKERFLWLKSVGAYTAGGVLTAAMVGAVLGFAGRVVGTAAPYVFTGAAVLALVLIARELGWIRFPLPQVRRQTQKMWALEFGFVTGAAMWGAHIGLAFTTVVKHGGFFVLVALAAVLGPGYAALLFATYWIGRTLPIWMTPALTSSYGSASALSDLVTTSTDAYRHIAAAGLLCAGVAALALGALT